MSGQDIVERLRKVVAGGLRDKYGPDGDTSFGKLMLEAADAIAALRYDHERDAEKIAALSRQVEVLERLCGAISSGPSYRETTKDMKRNEPRHGATPKPMRWPEVGTHE